MPYAGKNLQGRDAVEIVRIYWPNLKVEATAVACAETGGTFSLGAWHDNLDKDGELASRDLGLFQINVPARIIGTPEEFELRTESLVVEEYDRVARNNTQTARALFDEPWVFPDGTKGPRQWQAWVAYTTGWALYGEPWVWSRLGRGWVPTGRYLHKAIRAVANWHLFIQGDLGTKAALEEAERLADIYGAKGALGYTDKLGVFWRFPPKPVEPGSLADYPVPNDGRSVMSPK